MCYGVPAWCEGGGVWGAGWGRLHQGVPQGGLKGVPQGAPQGGPPGSSNCSTWWARLVLSYYCGGGAGNDGMGQILQYSIRSYIGHKL